MTYRRRSTKFISSSRLYSKPTIIVGMGSILNIAGNYYDFNYSLTETEADKEAIENDWRTIGRDLKKAMESV